MSRRGVAAAWVVVAAVVIAGAAENLRPAASTCPSTRAAPSAAPVRSADELVSDAKAAIADQATVQVSGETTSDGRRVGGELAFRGDAGSGTFSFGGGVVRLLYADGRALYKGDSAIYSAFGVKPAAITRRIGDRWIIVNSTNPKLVPLQLPSDRTELLDSLIDPGASVVAGEPTTVDGTAAVALTGERATLVVATGTSLPIRVILPGDDGDGITFTYGGDVAAPVAPAPDQIVDLGDLR